MLPFLTRCWQVLSHSFDSAGVRRLPRTMPSCACEAPRARPARAEERSRAEQLEYIALLAQAGYFNMGNAVDLFQPPIEPPPS